ncbi:MAG: ribonuclease J, partial [Deltaproteobacteria bacterium]|nr:ribonuclease J [Deltaproteobacteria bacterium]
MVYETDDSAVIVDCGTMFPDQETLGIDLIIPDFTYLNSIRKKLKGVIFTHGHEDHAGAAPFLLKEFFMPAYGSAFTIGLIREKLTEYSLPKTPRLNVFTPGDRLEIGSFVIDTIFVNHSIIGACGLVFHTEEGSLVHLTDWKIDKNPVDGHVIDLKKFDAIGREGVLALFSDSTNAFAEGKTISEKEVRVNLHKVLSKHPGRIIVSLFSSNIHRVQSLAKIAKELGRSLALVGRSMHENTDLARSLGALNLDGINVIDVEQTSELLPEKVMLLATGSQGEPRSVLSRMAVGEFKPFKIREGDLVLFSSRTIPGNEQNVGYMINHLTRHGAVVVSEMKGIHTSGHAHQEEIEIILKKLKPRYLIPIHGEYRHLAKQGDLAAGWGMKRENILVIENGDTLLFEGGKAHRFGEVPTGRVFVDGHGVGDVSDMVIRDRRHLSQTGIVICVLMIDRKSGEILRGPELISKGLTMENAEIMDRAKKGVLEAINKFSIEARTDLAEVHEEVRLTLMRFFRKELDRKPMVIPVIQEV